jgi:integrase/recombinase XerD
MKPFYYSIYGPVIEEYVALKRSLGYKLLDIEYAFRRFDLFVLDKEETSIGLSKEFCEEWCTKRPNESEKSWYNRIQLIRNFSSFLQALNYTSFLPKLPGVKGCYVPYIYSRKEIASIFKECDELVAQSSIANSIVLIVPCLFRLLYGTGLRLGEALSLLCNDFNLHEQCILLRDTKNGKDRIVPISESLSKVCVDYLECRKRFPIRRKTDLFFIHPNGEKCTARQAYRWFRKVLFNVGIPHQGKHQGPHIHHLRHTFSVHSLATMAEANYDLNYSLPILSTYLGHQSIAATDKYVRLTAEMYPNIIAKVNKTIPLVYPDIYKHTIHEAK